VDVVWEDPSSMVRIQVPGDILVILDGEIPSGDNLFETLLQDLELVFYYDGVELQFLPY
jgi:hypothetical protein